MVGGHIHLDVHVLAGPVAAHDDAVGVEATGLVGARLLVPGVAADAALAPMATVLVLWRRSLIRSATTPGCKTNNDREKSASARPTFKISLPHQPPAKFEAGHTYVHQTDAG